MGLFSFFRGGKREQSTVAPASETFANREQRNVSPRIAPNREQRNVAPEPSRGSHIAGTSCGPSSGGPDLDLDLGFQLRFFPYSQICRATNNFSNESLIGRGDFGSVFKGRRLEQTGPLTAVRVLNDLGIRCRRTELGMLCRLRHANIIKLIGFYDEVPQVVVYEFMPFGSLERHLHSNIHEVRPLDWNTRMSIAAGVARALDFLQYQLDTPVIFRDLRSSNVLLGKGFHPKLSGFWLAKYGPKSEVDRLHISTTIGDPGYWAPEYEAGIISLKTDVYAFGILLLEIVTGVRASNSRHTLLDLMGPMLRDRRIATISIADPKLKGQFPESLVDKAIEFALACTREDPDSRPTMKQAMVVTDCLRSVKYDPSEGTSKAARGCQEKRAAAEQIAQRRWSC